MSMLSPGVRIAVFSLTLFCLGLAIRCLFSNRQFYAGTSPNVDHLMRLEAWGVLFIVVSFGILAGLVRGSPEILTFSLSVFSVSMIGWAIGLAAASASDPLALPWIWPLSMATVSYAMVRSIHSRQGGSLS